jgi:hypothetical protein
MLGVIPSTVFLIMNAVNRVARSGVPVAPNGVMIDFPRAHECFADGFCHALDKPIPLLVRPVGGQYRTGR